MISEFIINSFSDLLVLVCYTVVYHYTLHALAASPDSSVPSASPTSFGVSLVDCFGEIFISYPQLYINSLNLSNSCNCPSSMILLECISLLMSCSKHALSYKLVVECCYAGCYALLTTT